MSNSSAKLSYTNIHCLCSNFLLNLSLNETLPILFYVRQTWQTQMNLAISCIVLQKGLQKGFMHSLAVFAKEELPFAWELSLENSDDSYCFRLDFVIPCLTFFSYINHYLHISTRFLMLFHPTYMRFSKSTHLLMHLSLETLTSSIRQGLK